MENAKLRRGEKGKLQRSIIPSIAGEVFRYLSGRNFIVVLHFHSFSSPTDLHSFSSHTDIFILFQRLDGSTGGSSPTQTKQFMMIVRRVNCTSGASTTRRPGGEKKSEKSLLFPALNEDRKFTRFSLSIFLCICGFS